jgi:hypothetical protein
LIVLFNFLDEKFQEAKMAITRYEPFTILNQLQRELDRVRDGEENGGRIATAEWAPAVDIKEEEQRFVIHADIPGVTPEDIDVKKTTISGSNAFMVRFTGDLVYLTPLIMMQSVPNPKTAYLRLLSLNGRL